MKNKQDILKQFKRHYQISKSGLKAQWKHIDECQAFYSGDYMNYRDDVTFGRGASRRVKEVSFNRVKPYVNSVVGFFAQQRRKPDYQAQIENLEDQAAYSDYLNGYSDDLRDKSNADQAETRQDKDMVIGGVGITDTGITLKAGSPTRDPSGEVIIERVDPRQCGWDSEATAPNVLDSRWVYRAKDYDVEEAEELFNAEEEDFDFVNPDDDITDFEYNPYGGIQDKIGYEWADAKRNMVRVYFYQWFEVENFYRIENPLKDPMNQGIFEPLAVALAQVQNDEDSEETSFRFDPAAEVLVITKDIRKDVKEVFEQFGLKFDPVTEKRKVYYTAIISGSKVFDAFKSVSQQGFSLKFKTGDYDERNKIWTGIVASMRDPQRYYNKSLAELMLIIASNARGGVMYEEGAVDNIQEFEASWARKDAATRVNDGALTGGKIQPKAVPAMNTGYEGILEVSGAALSQVTGIDESFFGAIAGGNETAMLQRQRIKQATTTLALYFDAIALYTKEQARLMLSYMRLLAKSGEGRLFKMTDDDGNPIFERLSPDFLVDDYDIKIGEAPETPLQQEFYTNMLMKMAESMLAIGDPRASEIFAASLKYLPIPNRDKTSIIKILTGQQQIDPALVQQLQARVQELEGQQSQMMLQSVQAGIAKTMAETQEKLAKVKQTEADVGKTLEETEKAAIENDIMAGKNYREVNVTI